MVKAAPASAHLTGRVLDIDVPATSANIGAGFDTLALALDRSCRIRLEVVEGGSPPPIDVVVEGEGAGRLPSGRRNRFVQALLDGLAAGGSPASEVGWRVRMDNDIPVSRGLGSSAAATVAALVAADALLEGRLGRQRILELAAEAEGHADNAAAALYGGLCVVSQSDGRSEVVRLDPPSRLRVALFIPDRPLSTAAMREALPEEVPFADAVHNVGAAALAVAAFSTDRLELLLVATRDRLHQPYRASAYPELPALIEAALASGAMGACLSGAGSAVIAFSDDETAAHTIAGSMARRAAELGLPGRGAVHAARADGARVTERPEPPPGRSSARLP